VRQIGWNRYETARQVGSSAVTGGAVADENYRCSCCRAYRVPFGTVAVAPLTGAVVKRMGLERSADIAGPRESIHLLRWLGLLDGT
jgi:hypothetical protein